MNEQFTTLPTEEEVGEKRKTKPLDVAFAVTGAIIDTLKDGTKRVIESEELGLVFDHNRASNTVMPYFKPQDAKLQEQQKENALALIEVRAKLSSLIPSYAQKTPTQITTNPLPTTE